MATSNSANLVTEIAAAPVSFRRRAMNALVTGAAAGAVLLVLLPLGAIFVYLVYKGFGSLNWAFLTQIPKPVGEAGGGMANAIAGSAYILLIASSGVLTGIMLAFARVAGETAPLLFTAFGNQYWNWKMNQPTAALPLQIFTYAISPFDEWHRQAWAGALILIILIVVSVSAVRIAAGRGMLKGVS